LESIKIVWNYLIKPVLYRHRKRILIGSTSFVLLLWIGISFGFFRSPFSKIKAFEAISDNMAIVLETSQYKSNLDALRQKSYYQGLQSISIIKKWERGLRLIDSLFQATESYSTILDKAHIVSGVQIISNDNADWLYALDNYDQSFSISNFLAELMPSKIIETIYRGRTIYKLAFGNGKKLSITVFHGLILMSTKIILIERGIEQLDNIESNVNRNESFNLVKEQTSSDGSKLTIYFNFKTIASLISVISKSNPRAIMNLASIGEWTGLDARFLEKGFILSGHMYPRSDNKFLKALVKQEAPKNSQIAQYIPKNLGAMLYLGWGDFEAFYRSYQEVEYKDFEKYFLPWIGRDVALIIKDPTDDENAFFKDKLLFVHSKDTAKTWRLLNKYANQFGELNRRAYQNFEITQIAAHHPLRPLFGEDINPIQNPYYTIIGDYIVFANSLTTLEGWIKSYNTGQMILELPEYHSFFTQAKNQSNIYALLSTPNSMKFLQHFMRDELHEYIQEPFQKFRNIYPIGIQFFGLEDHFLMTLSASYNKVREKELNHVTIAWEADMDADAAIAPQAVKSHDGNHYILAQDVLHRMYFFDKNGENIWSKDKVLNRRINSEIFEIDIHDNGQIQYAFSTDSAIYVVNKEGVEIKEIPLISRAANGVMVIDYGKGPRFFIACRNGNVYGYEQNGKPLSGWQPLERIGRVDYSMKFMKYKEKRYFMMANKSGRCQAFKRNGQPYFRGAKLGKVGGWGVDASIGRIVAGNSNGKIRVLNSEGKGFGFAAVPGMTKGVQFIYADVMGDKRKDYIRISDDKIAVHYYHQEKNKKGKMKDFLREGGVYDLAASAKRKIFDVSITNEAKKYIGLLELENGSISLLNARGEVQNGFPLAGTSTFEVVDLFGENGNTLVVANNNKIYAYKLKL
jgi:hypothetical protein